MLAGRTSKCVLSLVLAAFLLQARDTNNGQSLLRKGITKRSKSNDQLTAYLFHLGVQSFAQQLCGGVGVSISFSPSAVGSTAASPAATTSPTPSSPSRGVQPSASLSSANISGGPVAVTGMSEASPTATSGATIRGVVSGWGIMGWGFAVVGRWLFDVGV